MPAKQIALTANAFLLLLVGVNKAIIYKHAVYSIMANKEQLCNWSKMHVFKWEIVTRLFSANAARALNGKTLSVERSISFLRCKLDLKIYFRHKFDRKKFFLDVHFAFITFPIKIAAALFPQLAHKIKIVEIRLLKEKSHQRVYWPTDESISLSFFNISTIATQSICKVKETSLCVLYIPFLCELKWTLSVSLSEFSSYFICCWLSFIFSLCDTLFSPRSQ